MSMVVVGDVHGAIGALYEKAREFRDKHGTSIDAILQVGDLQIYSDVSQVDKAVKKHGGVGEFPVWLREGRRAPIPTYAILGNHDDSKLFYEYAGREILPSLHLLAQGEVASIVLGGNTVRVGALGGNYSPRYFKAKPDELPPGKLKHYTESHIAQLVENIPFDILLVHEAPTGFVIRDGSDLGRPEVRDLIELTQPRFVFFGHHHHHVEGMIGSTIVVGLAGIHMLGGLYLVRDI